jgi:hypothetical protein
MKQLVIVFVLALGLVGASGSFKENPQSDKFFNRDAGFAISKQPDWHFLSLDNAETWMTDLNNSEEGKRQLKQHIQGLREQEAKTGMAPLFIAKHEEPYPSLNPMIQVSLHYIDDLPKDVSPLAIAAVMAKSVSESNQGFEMMDQIRLVQISNLDAGYLSFALNGEPNSEDTESAVNQVYLIPRGKYVFEITLSTPLELDDDTVADLEEMMETIFILKPFEI